MLERKGKGLGADCGDGVMWWWRRIFNVWGDGSIGLAWLLALDRIRPIGSSSATPLGGSFHQDGGKGVSAIGT